MQTYTEGQFSSYFYIFYFQVEFNHNYVMNMKLDILCKKFYAHILCTIGC